MSKKRSSNVEAVKAAILPAIKTIVNVDAALEDGKISVGEYVKIATSALGFWKTVRNINQSIEAYKALSRDEKDELILFFVEEFNIRNQDVEKVIEHLFASLIHISTLSQEIKNATAA